MGDEIDELDDGQNNLTRNMVIPALAIPGYRQRLACKYKIEKNIMLHTWGGLGDQVCAEPTIRHAVNNFVDCKISLAAQNPCLYTHIKFEKVFNLQEHQPHWNQYYPITLITPPDNIMWQFFSHGTTNCVDFSSLCALRSQLPVADREVQLPDCADKTPGMNDILVCPNKYVIIHAGKHWPSKTFPKDWWDAVLAAIIAAGKTPVLIGADCDDNRGTVNVETTHCLDLRNKLSIAQSVHILKYCIVLLTNDSAPLHMAAAGDAWIGFMATCKHPDYITHWRQNQWGWRMKNFASAGVYSSLTLCPNTPDRTKLDEVEENELRSWLPNPHDLANWAVNKLL